MCTYVYNIMSRVNSQDMCICEASLRSDKLPNNKPKLGRTTGNKI